MCFYNSMSKKAKEVAARYGLKTDIVEIYEEILNEQYRVNAFTHPLYPIVTDTDQLQAFRWGLIPYWVKSEEQAKDIENMTINAKCETIFEKPSFRQSIISRRCIVPSTGFFEWRHEDKIKQPYYIHTDEEIFSMAGIYDIWNNGGNLVHTFTIITTEANELMSFVHNSKKRMPVILSRENEKEWLNPTLSKSSINELLKPFETNRMNAYPISRDFLKLNPKDESIILSA